MENVLSPSISIASVVKVKVKYSAPSRLVSPCLQVIIIDKSFQQDGAEDLVHTKMSLV